jgi:hypothetical protein
MPAEPLWRVETQSSVREQALSEPFDLDQLVAQLMEETRNVRYKKEKGSHEAKGSWRPTFTFEVSEMAFDRFFNSPHGYRSKFLIDAAIGQAANAQVVSGLAQTLLQYSSGDAAEIVKSSLLSSHSKIWIEEGQHSPATPELVIEIPVPTWVAAARASRERLNNGDSTITPKEVDRIYGVRAPVGTKLKVMGAWVGSDSSLSVVPSKFTRAKDIQAYGIS